MHTPTKFGVLLYPGFEVLDVFGPLEALNTLSRPLFGPAMKDVSLSVIAASLADVTPGQFGSSWTQRLVPTHTVHDPPVLDVLLIPGGLGSDAPGTEVYVNFIKNIYPKLKYLITVCTGADLAARAGVLDGKRATTNKMAFKNITRKKTSGKTYWVAHARWVESGNVWTTSGVSAGTDGMIAWIAKVYGEDFAENIVQGMEWIRQPNPENDPFTGSNVDVPPVSST